MKDVAHVYFLMTELRQIKNAGTFQAGGMEKGAPLLINVIVMFITA